MNKRSYGVREWGSQIVNSFRSVFVYSRIGARREGKGGGLSTKNFLEMKRESEWYSRSKVCWITVKEFYLKYIMIIFQSNISDICNDVELEGEV